MSDGWVKLHRQLLDSRVFGNPELLKLWVYCLLRANHTKTWVTINTGRGTTEVELMPGQFIFGRNEAAKSLNMKPTSIRYRMSTLSKIGCIGINPASHYSIISICNWDTYQDQKSPVGQPTANQLPTNCQPTATDKNVKNEKKKKKKKKERARSKFSFPVDGQTEDWPLPQDKLDEWTALFRTIGVEAQIGLARQWLLDNPTRKKTANGMTRFLGSWLTRACNSNSGAQGSQQQPTIPKGIPAHLLPGIKP